MIDIKNGLSDAGLSGAVFPFVAGTCFSSLLSAVLCWCIFFSFLLFSKAYYDVTKPLCYGKYVVTHVFFVCYIFSYS